MDYKPIPAGAWMQLRQHGRTKYALNKTPIVWQSEPPPDGSEVFTIAWRNGQQTLHYKFSRIMKGNR